MSKNKVVTMFKLQEEIKIINYDDLTFFTLSC